MHGQQNVKIMQHNFMALHSDQSEWLCGNRRTTNATEYIAMIIHRYVQYTHTRACARTHKHTHTHTHTLLHAHRIGKH